MTISARARLIAGLAAALLLAAGCGPKYEDARLTAASSACTNASVLTRWSVPRLARQTIVVPVQESDVGAVGPQVAAGIGGVILFGSKAPASLRSDLAALVRKAPRGIRPLVMSDEEGGAVQRMANLVGTMPSARRMGATLTATQIRSLARTVGTRMHRIGVTTDLAPVLDLDGGRGPNSTDAIGTRSFSTKPSTAAADGLAFANGMRDAGVLPVVKHFPGLGGASGNTDLRPAHTLPWSVLRTSGLLPFRSAVRAGIPAVMVSNAWVPGLTPRPAGLSPTVIRTVLRTDLHFTGLVMTDSLSAGAVSGAGYSVPRATVAALAAGADMVLFGAATSRVAALTQQIVDAVVAAVAKGTVPRVRLQDAARHVLVAKHVNLCA